MVIRPVGGVPVTKPGAVTNLKAAAAKGSIVVTWSPPTNLGGSEPVTYQYMVGTTAWKPTPQTTVTVTGKKGTRVTVKVRAANEAGFGPPARVSAVPR